jgi:hypothetical protein
MFSGSSHQKLEASFGKYGPCPREVNPTTPTSPFCKDWMSLSKIRVEKATPRFSRATFRGSNNEMVTCPAREMNLGGR